MYNNKNSSSKTPTGGVITKTRNLTMKIIIGLCLTLMLCLISKAIYAQDTLTTCPYNYSTSQWYQPNALVHTQFDMYYMVGQTDTLGAGGSNVFLYETNPNSDRKSVV